MAWIAMRGVPIGVAMIVCAAALVCAAVFWNADAEEAPAAFEEVIREQAPTLRYRSDVRNVLIAGADGADLRILTLASVSNRGEVVYMAIPRDTRVKSVGAVGEAVYARLCDIFEREGGGRDGLGALRGAVSALFGGIPVDNGLIFGEDATRALIDALGGVEVERRLYADFKTKTGGTWRILGEADADRVVLGSEEAMAFVRGGAAETAEVVSGTDLVYISLSQRLTDSLVERARAAGPEAIAAMLDAADYSALDESAREELISFLSIPVTYGAVTALLGGEERAHDTQYWLPDEGMIKRWVVERYYEVR